MPRITEFGKGVLKGFCSFSIKSSTFLKENYFTFWKVQSNMKRDKFIHYCKLRLLYETTDGKEQQFLFDAIDFDPFFVACYKLKGNLEDDRVGKIAVLFGLKNYTRKLYRQWNGNVKFHIIEIGRPIGKITKFSGYVRSSSSVGSKRPNKTNLDPRTEIWTEELEYNYVELLTVGRAAGRSVGLSLP